MGHRKPDGSYTGVMKLLAEDVSSKSKKSIFDSVVDCRKPTCVSSHFR